jgi:hypothetical protein
MQHSLQGLALARRYHRPWKSQYRGGLGAVAFGDIQPADRHQIMRPPRARAQPTQPGCPALAGSDG